MQNKKYTNNLVKEKSLYLKQHAHNPVHWLPWGFEALEKAKKENKPLLLSIGYSSCHWCHVMAHESFENPFIADLMNRHFVCIKIDREERPDLDQIYMDAVQMLNQSGGWPLNVFCLPDGRPFFGGTYFPPEDRGHGIIPWPQLLMRIAEYYRKDPNALIENANNIVNNLHHINTPLASSNDLILSEDQLLAAARGICLNHDDTWGGFGKAPKFPPSMTLGFLLSLRNSSFTRTKDPALIERIDFVIQKTLTQIALGGIFDQIGGGFSRYSVDAQWSIPHFEKMLYDNGQLLKIYTYAYTQYKLPLFKSVIEETIAWLKREMLGPLGLFYASIDADSEGHEGRFYAWTPEAIIKILDPEEASTFNIFYSITPEGNFEKKTSIPRLTEDNFSKRQSLSKACQKLLTARSQRPHPTVDTKHMISWNCLAIQGLTEAGFYLNRSDYFELAINALDTLWEKYCINPESSTPRLHSVFYPNNTEPASAFIPGYLSDYTYFIETLLTVASKSDWYAPLSSQHWITLAERLMHSVLEFFNDPTASGFYFTASDQETLICRKKEWFDNALPSSNSSLLSCLVLLHALTHDSKYKELINKFNTAYSGLALQVPSAVAHALTAYTYHFNGSKLISYKNVSDTDVLWNNVRALPFGSFFITDQSPSQQHPSGYQLCDAQGCHLPVATASLLFINLPEITR